MIIFIISKWKKVLSKCCLTILKGIARLITKTQTNSTGCFGTSFAYMLYGVV
jgi:hypothetical protein